MELQIKHHIEMKVDDNPLAVRLTERPFKAYMVANLAFLDGAEASAEHYRLSLGAVYAAMSFYEDNRDAIQQALEAVRAIDLGDMEVSPERIEEIRQRLNEIQSKSANQQKPE